MVSTYGYSTVAALELYASEDFGLIDATYLTDPHVEAKITAGEQIVNTWTGVVKTAPIPDAYVIATNMIATKLIYRWLLTHGHKLSENQKKEALKPLIDKDVEHLLSKYVVKDVVPIRSHRIYNNVGDTT